ncbi:gluconate 2-dehydrogenase subunit 3 family protein [Frateuria aurantia]
MERRDALKSMASLTALGAAGAVTGQSLDRHTVLSTAITPDALPRRFKGGGLKFFSKAEAETVAAIYDRLIPSDELSIGATEAGCVIFADAQLAGDFGKAASEYRQGPYQQGTPEQAPQDRQTPADRYRHGLVALDMHCRTTHGRPFVQLDITTQDQVLGQLETGSIHLVHTDGVAFFNLLLQNVREGFMSDPIYGGNKGMVSWKLLGFPGARYDFRDVIDRRGQKLDIIPSSLVDR